MKLKEIGFVRKAAKGLSLEQIKLMYPIGTLYQDCDRLAAYLSSGVICVGSPGIVCDIIAGTEEPIGSGSLLTDGKWLWPDDLGYYILRYKIELPVLFITFARERDYLPPCESEIDFSILDFN